MPVQNANELKGPLNTSRIQTSNQALWQVITALIAICADLQARVTKLENS